MLTEREQLMLRLDLILYIRLLRLMRQEDIDPVPLTTGNQK